jgi:hypothetical protein
MIACKQYYLILFTGSIWLRTLTKILTSPEIFGYDTHQVKFHLKFWRNKPWLRKTWNPNKPLLCNGKSIPLPLRVVQVQVWHPIWKSQASIIASTLLRATMRSNPFDSNTHLKKCQKSFSNCQGARFASMNWRTILVSSGLSDTWHGVWTRRDLDFLGVSGW